MDRYIDIEKLIIEKIKEYNRIIIHHHIRPDGDCIGSQMGLKYILQETFPKKEIYAVGGDVPPYLEYVADHDTISDELYKGALVICVDTGKADRVFDKRYATGDFLIKIDHHDDSDDYGNINLVYPRVAACSAIIASICLDNQDIFKIPVKAANALYFGITTDTGRFRYRGVDGDALRAGASLIDMGADIEDIYTHLYTDELATLKLRGFVYNTFKSSKNGVLYMHFTNKIMKKFKVSREDAGNLVNSLDSVKGSMIWIALIDQENGDIRVRLRSRSVPINDIARNYRGGGHMCAAGATLKHKKEIAKLVSECDERLKQYKEEHPEAF